MKRYHLAAIALLALASVLPAQTVGKPQTPQSSAAQPTTKGSHAPKPAMQEAPGGGPDKVWVNTNSSAYHCPGDRFYGKTAHGRYMTEAQAKAAGAHGPRGKTCFGGK